MVQFTEDRKFSQDQHEKEKEAILEEKLMAIEQKIADAEAKEPVAQFPETKREEFTRYLEKTNVFESISRVLYELYKEPEKPIKPVGYFLEHLSRDLSIQMELDYLAIEYNDQLRALDEAREENFELKNQLGDLGMGSSEEDYGSGN